jgi:voltage-gated potassium channel
MDRSEARELLASLVILVVLVALYYVLPLKGSDWRYGVLIGLAVVIGMAPLVVIEVRRILASAHPVPATVRALVVLFAVAVLGFAITYYSLEAHSPGEMVGLETKTDALYFTVTVLSTVGFGDIHAQGQVARAVTTGQMVFNLVLLAVAVRVITWAARERAQPLRDRVLAGERVVRRGRQREQE